MTTDAEPYSMIDWPTVERTRIADGTEFVLGRQQHTVFVARRLG